MNIIRTYIVILAILAPSFVQAAPWIICNYTIKPTKISNSSVHAIVINVMPNNPSICLNVGDKLSFKPETEDYQQYLPRKLWPKPNQTSKLRYRKLNGFCKNDGDQEPCTITHYSIIESE